MVLDWEHRPIMLWPKHLKQKILELEAKVRLLEKQKARAELLCRRSGQEAIIFDYASFDDGRKDMTSKSRKNYTTPGYRPQKKKYKETLVSSCD